MSLFENNLPRDDQPDGAHTSLIRSLDELNTPAGEGPSLSRRRSLRCDAFRVEYTTVPGETRDLVRGIAIIPSAPTGFPEGRYTLTPQPHGGFIEDLTSTLAHAEKTGMLGSALLSELMKIQVGYPGYEWKPSHGEPTQADREVPVATPILLDFATFAEYPKWTPRYEMKVTQGDHTNRVAAFFRDGLVWCFFSSISEGDEGDRFAGKIKLRYEGPELTPEDHPGVIGERVMAGISRIMESAQSEGPLHTLEALVRRELKPTFLEPVQEPASSPLSENQEVLLDPAPRSLASGAVTQWWLGGEMNVASLNILANSKAECAKLTLGFPYGQALDPKEYMAEVSTAYLNLSSKSESRRLSGLLKMRELEPSMTFVGPSLPRLLGGDGTRRLAELSKYFDIKQQLIAGSSMSIANISALCDGIEQVELILGREPRSTGLYRHLTLGWAPDGSLHFAAKSGVGGLLEGVLSHSTLAAERGRTHAALSLVELFGQQQVEDRVWFERRVNELVSKNDGDTSFAISDGSASYCSMPPVEDQEGQAAYRLGASLARTFDSLSQIPSRVSVNYSAPGTCEVLFGYSGSPYDMTVVLTGTTLKGVKISPALPRYADPVRRLPPLYEVETEQPLVDSSQGVQDAGDLLSKYLTLARESTDPSAAKPLIQSALYEKLRALEVQPARQQQESA